MRKAWGVGLAMTLLAGLAILTAAAPSSSCDQQCSVYAQNFYDSCIAAQGSVKRCSWIQRQAYNECMHFCR